MRLLQEWRTCRAGGLDPVEAFLILSLRCLGLRGEALLVLPRLYARAWTWLKFLAPLQLRRAAWLLVVALAAAIIVLAAR